MCEPAAVAAVHSESSGNGLPGSSQVWETEFPMSIALLNDRLASRPKRTIQDPFGEPVKAAKRILVVDDCSDGRRMIADILNCIGFEVTVANGGQAGCDLALSAAKSRDAFDLILMDVQMPGFDGYEATAQLRASGYRGRIVALKSENCLFDATDARSQEAGCDGYASKPITFAMLRDIVRRYIPAESVESVRGCEPTNRIQMRPARPSRRQRVMRETSR
jgi:CheY-like chemotaxis protein